MSVLDPLSRTTCLNTARPWQADPRVACRDAIAAGAAARRFATVAGGYSWFDRATPRFLVEGVSCEPPKSGLPRCNSCGG